MFALAVCLFFFLATATLARSAERETAPDLPVVEAPLCGLVRFAVNRPDVTEEIASDSRDEEISGEAVSERLPIHPESRAAADRLNADRRLFESSLINWQFFEDLAPQQRSIIRGVFTRCGATTARSSQMASVFGGFNASQRATFVGVTHALLNTQLVDSQDGSQLGTALQLIEELMDIEGENNVVPSDHQFQMIVRLTPGALGVLQRSVGFDKGENHVFHKGYPLSFRQIRRIGLHGQEAGLHFCVARDGRFAQVHIDYRFGLLHLQPSNSDVRANGNHQRHVDRWPNFRLSIKRVKVLRVVLPERIP